MHAVIKTGGKQYRIEPGDEIDVEKIKGVEADQRIAFQKVLAAGEGEAIEVGRPYLEDVRVVARVLEHGRGPKKVVFKKKTKEGYQRKKGHRQPYTRVEITDVQHQEEDETTAESADEASEASEDREEGDEETAQTSSDEETSDDREVDEDDDAE